MSRAASPPGIALHIDEVVLEGFSPSEGRAVMDALEQELGRLLAAGPGIRTSRTAQGLDGGAIARDASPRALGRSAARAILAQVRGSGR